MRHLSLKHIIFLACLSFFCMDAQAQFFLNGEDPGSIRWKEISSKTYRVIYPEGLDSLAKEYLIYLELIKMPVSQSLGYVPNQSYRKQMPVVLHPYSVMSNGTVTWTPRRVEFVTTPSAYRPESTPWMLQLTLHESRHVAQMQYVNDSWRKYLGYPFGELAAGAFSALYCGPHFFEGDAVVAETALTDQGRGRSADFLEYLRACFTAGETRDYWKWRYGSIKNYTPDYYRIGYITMAGMKVNEGFKEWPFSSMRKDFARAFPTLADSLKTVWQTDNDARAPFIKSDTLTRTGKVFTQYTKSTNHSPLIYSVKSGINESPALVSIDPDSGEERFISQFSNSSSDLSYSRYHKRIFWSETLPDKRWPAESYSDIFCLDSDGKIRRLTEGRKYFNPSCQENGGKIAVTEYTLDTRSNLVVLSGLNGNRLHTYSAPDNFQIVESTWIGDDIFVSAVSPDGFGIYRLSDFKPVVSGQDVKIKELDSYNGNIFFVCDLTGVDELYSVNPDCPEIHRLTSTENGISDYGWAGDRLFFSELRPEGRMIYKPDSLFNEKVDFNKPGRYPLAEELAAEFPDDIKYSEVEISEPKSYSKLAHLMHFHSWAPVYFKFSDVDNLSMSTLTHDAGLGATAFFQNELGTASGYVAYSAWTKDSGFRNGAHAGFTYSGFYPKFEFKADLNERNAYSYSFRDSVDVETKNKYIIRERTIDGRPYFNASLKVYVPFNFNSRGWLRGVIPQVDFNISNDVYDMGSSTAAAGASLGVRAYTMLRMTQGRIYPKFGIGGEVGISAQTGPYAFYPCETKTFLYGYLPGIGNNHGIKLTGAWHEFLGRDHRYFYLTFDYAIPFAPVEWSKLSPYIYVKNFEFTAHARYYNESNRGNIAAAPGVGASLVAHLGNLLWIPYDTRIGVSYLYYRTSSINLVFSIEL